MIKATKAAPMPIPAFAPVESPPLVATGTDVEDVGLEVGVVLDVGVFEGWGVVDVPVPTTDGPGLVLVLVVVANAASTVMGCPHI